MKCGVVVAFRKTVGLVKCLCGEDGIAIATSGVVTEIHVEFFVAVDFEDNQDRDERQDGTRGAAVESYPDD
jgi:hypothetical protein